MNPTAGPWHASDPHPDTGMRVITNDAGRVVAMVPSEADADFICQAREAQSGMPLSMKIDWVAFGEQVRVARGNKRESQGIAAKLCGISRNYMSMIERGIARDPGYTIILTLCTWLGLEMPQPSDRS